MQPWDTHEPASDWIPLAAAPSLDYLGGYEIGYRLQASGEPNEFQRVALRVAGVPDGRPDPAARRRRPTAWAAPEPSARSSRPGRSCSSRAPAPTRSRSRSGRARAAPSDCLAGPSTTASFGVDVRVAPALAGAPLSFRAVPLPGNPFVGVRAAAPPGGQADIRCALDGTVQPDGSVAGSIVVPDADLSRPAGARARLPAPRRLDVRRPRHRRGPGRQPRHDRLQHAVVRAAEPRRGQRLPAPHGHDQAPARQAPALHLQGRVARCRRGRPRRRHAVPRHRLPGRAVQAPQGRDLPGPLRRQAHARRDPPPAGRGLLPRALLVLRDALPAGRGGPQPDAAGRAPRPHRVRRPAGFAGCPGYRP